MTKKHLVLTALFILPIVIYLFLASGVHNFSHLPVIGNNVSEVNGFTSLHGKPVSMNKKITVLGFLGDDLSERKINAYNLHEEIYKGNYYFEKNFQMLMLLPKGTEAQVKEVIEELKRYTKIDRWEFAFGTPAQIKAVFKSLKSPHQLDTHIGSDYVFIIDKELNLRGRVEDEDFGKMYAYNATSIAELHNKMEDDIKVLLAEYNLALKKNYKVSRRDRLLKPDTSPFKEEEKK